MLLLYGKRTIRVRKHDDFHVKCESCNDYGQRFFVYQEYFHLFFIPLFPTGNKTISSTCLKCNDNLNEEKRNHYLSTTRTPLYLYSGIILFVALILALVTGNILTQKKKAEYIAHPEVNDIYLIRQEENKQINYYFLKIKEIESDTVRLLSGYFQYNRFVSSMDETDYFVEDEIYSIPKEELKKLLDDGMINMVIRK